MVMVQKNYYNKLIKCIKICKRVNCKVTLFVLCTCCMPNSPVLLSQPLFILPLGWAQQMHSMATSHNEVKLYKKGSRVYIATETGILHNLLTLNLVILALLMLFQLSMIFTKWYNEASFSLNQCNVLFCWFHSWAYLF